MTKEDIRTASRHQLESKVITLQDENAALRERLDWLQKQVFGPRSEKSHACADGDQSELDLGLAPVALAEAEPAEDDADAVPAPKRKARKPKSDIPKDLPVYSDTTLLPEGVDPAQCETIGEEISRKLEIVPARIGWHIIRRPKMRDIEGAIHIAALPPHCNEKGLAGASIEAKVYADKFQFHLPLYRQASSIQQETGVAFAVSTLGDMVANVDFWLQSIALEIRKAIVAQPYVQADETRMPVLGVGEPGKVHSGYQWVVNAPLLRAVAFMYRDGRRQECAEDLLVGFAGKLQTDAYGGYNPMRKDPAISMVGCMAHARRKFFEAKDHPRLRKEVLAIFARLYAVEEQARDEMKERELGHGHRLALRTEASVPLMAELRALLDGSLVGLPPKSASAKAIGYALAIWDPLCEFLADGTLEIDNNLVENAIRPLALGRKNWMFGGSEDGARRTSTAYTIIGTARMQGLDPRAYVEMLLRELPRCMATKASLDRLMPWNAKASGLMPA
jgi:transposase